MPGSGLSPPLIAIVALVMSLAPACVGQHTPSPTETRKSAASLRVEVWSDWAFVATAAKQYVKAHPGITITVDSVPGEQYFQDLPRTLAATNPPDITALEVVPGPYDSVLRNHLLADVSDVWNTESLLQAYSPGTVKAYRAPDGKFYAVNTDSTWMPIVLYNVDAMARAGIKPPIGRVASMADWFRMTDLLKRSGLLPLSTSISDEHGAAFMLSSLLQSSCGPGYDDLLVNWRVGARPTTRWTSPCVIAALTTLQDFAQRGVFGQSPATMSQAAAQTLFETGKAAMYSTGSWDTLTFATGKDKVPFKYGWFIMPPMPNGAPTRILMADLDGLGISSRSRQTAIAKDFLRTIVSRRYQSGPEFLKQGLVPARTDVTLSADANPLLLEQFKAIRTLGSGTQLTVAVPYQEAIPPLLARMFAGEVTVQASASALERSAEASRSGS